jgi:GxxExxY protein
MGLTYRGIPTIMPRENVEYDVFRHERMYKLFGIGTCLCGDKMQPQITRISQIVCDGKGAGLIVCLIFVRISGVEKHHCLYTIRLYSVVQNSYDTVTLNKLSYLLNGLAMRVHRELGQGFREIVYKDAFELELIEAGIDFNREKEFAISYRGVTLRHKYICDFIIANEVIIEVKAQNGIVDENYKQVINYLAVSKCRLGLIYNFAGPSLQIRRVVL